MIYLYNKNETADGTLDIKKLHEQVDNASIGSLLGITSDGSQFTIEFSEAVDESALDLIVAAHNDTPDTSKHCKIYQYTAQEPVDPTVAPRELNYITGLPGTRFYPARTMLQGEVQQVNWYSDPELTDLVIRVDVSYTRDTAGFALNRTTTRTWINEDGTDNAHTKVTTKYYAINPQDMIDEGKRRRQNIMNYAEMMVAGFLLATVTTGTEQEKLDMGREFIGSHKAAQDMFVDASYQQIYTDIQNDTRTWLDNVVDGQGTTIKQWLLAELNIWGL